MPPRKKKPKTNPAGLSNDDMWFVEEFVHNGRNATAAMLVVKPYLKYGSARTMASVALNKLDIRRAVEREERRRLRHRGSADRAISEAEALAYSHIGQVVDLKAGVLLEHIPAAAMRAIAQVEITPVKFGRQVYQKIKVRMHDKGGAVDKVFRHLGLYKELPDLERVFSLLPPAVAQALRDELAKGLPADGHPQGGQLPAVEPDPHDPLPEWAKPVPEEGGAGGGDGDPPGPELPVPGVGLEGGPVAGPLPEEHGQADADAVLPPGREERDERRPDAGPLFDDG
jgi:hypothetical protein